ncbi:hypothetical protein LWI29_005585 [Acer saccharum]|uniref:Uncharacterized protein n=1 Tax=Acer saccharum TaxID=4024 RepID=A0AA39VWX2_ACESA|nr:hypothetical protein LWI29_005585 [Acer saccharum]
MASPPLSLDYTASLTDNSAVLVVIEDQRRELHTTSRLGHSLRECSEVGDVKEVTSEANVRLNFWLRTVSPPKRFPGRSGRADHGQWGRQTGSSAYFANCQNVKPGGKWHMKNLAMEKGSSGEHWRKRCNQTVKGKLEGCLEPSYRCMGTNKGVIAPKKLDSPGKKKVGGALNEEGKQK